MLAYEPLLSWLVCPWKKWKVILSFAELVAEAIYKCVIKLFHAPWILIILSATSVSLSVLIVILAILAWVTNRNLSGIAKKIAKETAEKVAMEEIRKIICKLGLDDFPSSDEKKDYGADFATKVNLYTEK